MASYYCNDLRICVFQPPNVVPQPHVPAPLFVQLELTISIELSFVRHDCSVDHFSPAAEPFFSMQETLRFDLHLLRERNRLTEIVAPILRRLGFRPGTSMFKSVLNKVIRRGAPLLNCTSSMGPIVLPLHAKLRGTAVQHANREDCEPFARAISEWALRSRNYGMVPAKKSSVKEMVKRVGVEGGESSSTVKDQGCMICLEGFEVGSVAYELPCFHAFHKKCIAKWLKLSHYCPVCRFGLPTEKC